MPEPTPTPPPLKTSVYSDMYTDDGRRVVTILVVMPSGRYGFATVGVDNNEWFNNEGDLSQVPA